MALYIDAKSLIGLLYWDDFVVYGIVPEQTRS
jgi:hypothetical protein